MNESLNKTWKEPMDKPANEMKIVYPHMNRRGLFLYRLRQTLKWMLFLGAMVCPVVNYLTKGPLWSLVVIWGIVFFWKTFLSPDILEFSALSMVFRTSAYSIVLLALIGVLLSPGWLGFVLPIVGFGTLFLSAGLFLLNVSRRNTDAMPLIYEIVVALAAFFTVRAVTGILNWPMIVLGSAAALFIMVGLIAFHRSLLNEIKKRFHTR